MDDTSRSHRAHHRKTAPSTKPEVCIETYYTTPPEDDLESWSQVTRTNEACGSRDMRAVRRTDTHSSQYSAHPLAMFMCTLNGLSPLNNVKHAQAHGTFPTVVNSIIQVSQSGPVFPQQINLPLI